MAFVPPLTAKSVTAASILKKLRLSANDRKAAEDHANIVGLDSYRFSNSAEDQVRACETFADLGLYIPPDRDVRSKLAIITTDSEKCRSLATEPTKIRVFTRIRRLFQCLCGSDHEDGRHASGKRQMGWENVGCGAWFRLTSTHDVTDKENPILLTIDHILGDFTHSPQCLETDTMSRNPRIALEPALREFALSLLRKNTPLPQLRQQCREFSRARWESGIPQRSTPENNLHLWFRDENPSPPDPRLAASCLSYTPLIPGQSDRFSLILSTPEQRLLAWKYGHQKQLLMDLTFGVCNGRALLAILMVLDDQQKGLPVAFMLFTAKKDAKAVHADYNKELLKDLLCKWKSGMGVNEKGESFDARVAATDNDARERFGLRENWEEVWLLLCIFHVWQAWRNGLNKYLRAIPKGPDRKSIRTRLAKFLMRLLKEINIYEDAITAYNIELDEFKRIGRTRSEIAKTQSKAAIGFLTYLQGYLKVREIWQCWSLAGAEKAAELMGIPVSHVARTTNALESFNGRLKGVYFAQYQHSGRLPRIDVWVLTMITKVIPDFLDSWAEKRQLNTHYQNMRKVAPKTIKSTSTPSSPPLSRIVLNDPVPKSMSSQEFDARARTWLNSVLATPTSAVDSRYVANQNAQERADKLESALLDQIAADDTDDVDSNEGLPSDDAELELMADFGTALVVEPNGNTSISVGGGPELEFNSDEHTGYLTHDIYDTSVSDAPMVDVMEDMSAAASSSDFFDEIALEYSEIIRDLPSDVSLPFPFTSGQPNYNLSGSFHHSAENPPSSPSSNSNLSFNPHTNPSIRSAAQLRSDIEILEKQLAFKLHCLLDLGTEKEFLQHHISPSISTRLEQLAEESEFAAEDDREPAEGTSNLAPFETERKRKRIQSRNVW
ncbi:hypothetical protein R3P38DRAFT_3306410 [Favolaschia claudopus]|uniref:MULE transposase domain-containing protein n=1 Tax=Favolaschia claudopus TaxID=2862362 RepID=A0AAW0DFP9_9AGAR